VAPPEPSACPHRDRDRIGGKAVERVRDRGEPLSSS
jgi:hypothetical protein